MNLIKTNNKTASSWTFFLKEAQFHRPTEVKQNADQGGQEND